jgi:2-keto-4-pentenoate hydratase/2-oxohepta-3-ene-1,7-dioic acid hydratase in catechol pathway
LKLLRIGPSGVEKPAALFGGFLYDLSSITDEIDGEFLSSPRVSQARMALIQGSLPLLHVSANERIGSPIARPHNVICIGMNYAEHAAESGAEPPEVPILFFKPSSTVVGPNDPVEIPRDSLKTDWEVELGVVIGKQAHYLESPFESKKHLAGYVLANDVSERDFQLTFSGGQWSKGKSSPTFTPVGPWLVTPDEVPAGPLRLRSFVNGELRQESTTKDMIFDIDFLVWHLSQYMLLEPGDLLLTGTPQGVALSGRFPYLQEGDVCELDIDGLGRQRQLLTRARGAQVR